MGDASPFLDALSGQAESVGDVFVDGFVPGAVGRLVLEDFALVRRSGIVGIGSVVPLVALGDAAQRFGWAEDGVVIGGMADGLAFEAVLLVIKLQGGRFDSVNAS